jgi:HlyD family secretion protein
VKKRTLLTIAIALTLGSAGAAAYAFRAGSADGGASWRTVAVERGDLESVVSATGTLGAVKTVEVGTQTSGLIESLLVDFNDEVTEGQVIARLDTTLLTSAVRDAEANLERATAELRQAERDLARLTATHAQGITSDSDFNKAQYNLDLARASVKSADVAVSRARQNLGYATIRAPVSGTVVERDVDVGQTVAASLSAPKLYLIANDLSEMQILASVDESDIGLVKTGQTARFTVKAFPNRTFRGTVRQVRLQSTTEQNVVSYTVVVSVKNPDGVLLPGMTATVEFVTATAEDVLKVANAALRFRPPADVLAKLAASRPARPGKGRPAGPPPGLSRNGDSGFGTLWVADGTGSLKPARVRTGISDGQSTEVSGPSLVAGANVVTGPQKGAKAAEAEATTNPFQSQRQSGPGSGPPPPPGGF